MSTGLFSKGAVLPAVAILAIGLAGATNTPMPGAARGGSPVWSADAGRELEKAFHELHTLWNDGKLDSVKKLMVGDDVLVTFDLGNDNRPLAIRSKGELDRFLDRTISEAASAGGTYVLEIPTMHCRATDNLGICTEECTVRLQMADGTERIDHLYGTATAVRQREGWKWIQYHMSVGAAPELRSSQVGEKAEAPVRANAWQNYDLKTWQWIQQRMAVASASARRAHQSIDTVEKKNEQLRSVVRQLDEWKTPGLEAELSGFYPHPTDSTLYYVLANLKPPLRPGQAPMLAPQYRGKLLTVNKRTGAIVGAARIADDDFGGMAFGDGHFYVALTNAAVILKLDAADFRVEQGIPLPSPAGGLEYDAERKALIAQLYVGHPHLAVIDVASGTVTETLWSDESAMGLAKVDGDWLCTWATGWDPGSFSELRVIDQHTGKVRSRIRMEGVHTVLAPTTDDSGRPAFLSLVTVDSRSGTTAIRKYSYRGERTWRIDSDH